jgi:hypothetical protein
VLTGLTGPCSTSGLSCTDMMGELGAAEIGETA